MTPTNYYKLSLLLLLTYNRSWTQEFVMTENITRRTYYWPQVSPIAHSQSKTVWVTSSRLVLQTLHTKSAQAHNFIAVLHYPKTCMHTSVYRHTF